MENKALRITVGLTPEERDFLEFLQHEDAAANLSQAVAWCIDSCMKIEKLYGIDACYVAYNDIRKPENPPPSPAIEGKEEDGDKWQRLSDTLLKRSDWAHAIAAEKGQYYSGLSDGLAQAVKQMESLLEDKIEPPTTPAGGEQLSGAEGDGEKKSVHPEDLKQVEKTILEVLDTYLSAYPVPANFRKIHISGKQKAANYLALWMTGFWGAMDEGAEQWRSDFMDATEKLSAAQAKIAELEQTIREQKEWKRFMIGRICR